MRIILPVAGLEIALVALWVFAFKNTIGTPHQHWYVQLPLLFLIVPTAAVLISRTFHRVIRGSMPIASWALFIILISNLVGFAFFCLMSGGGV
jgi:hypothetical protein